MSNKKTNPNTNKLYEELVLTTVSNNKEYSQMLYFDKLSSGQNDEEPRKNAGMEADPSIPQDNTTSWTIKVFLN